MFDMRRKYDILDQISVYRSNNNFEKVQKFQKKIVPQIEMQEKQIAAIFTRVNENSSTCD